MSGIMLRHDLCTFNNDIQGTAGVVLAGLYGALRITGQRMRDQRVVFAGAGASAQGISELVTAFMEDGLGREEAVGRLWTTDSRGLVIRDRPNLEDSGASHVGAGVPAHALRAVGFVAERAGSKARQRSPGWQPRRHNGSRGAMPDPVNAHVGAPTRRSGAAPGTPGGEPLPRPRVPPRRRGAALAEAAGDRDPGCGGPARTGGAARYRREPCPIDPRPVLDGPAREPELARAESG